MVYHYGYTFMKKVYKEKKLHDEKQVLLLSQVESDCNVMQHTLDVEKNFYNDLKTKVVVWQEVGLNHDREKLFTQKANARKMQEKRLNQLEVIRLNRIVAAVAPAVEERLCESLMAHYDQRRGQHYIKVSIMVAKERL